MKETFVITFVSLNAKKSCCHGFLDAFMLENIVNKLNKGETVFSNSFIKQIHKEKYTI